MSDQSMRTASHQQEIRGHFVQGAKHPQRLGPINEEGAKTLSNQRKKQYELSPITDKTASTASHQWKNSENYILSAKHQRTLRPTNKNRRRLHSSSEHCASSRKFSVTCFQSAENQRKLRPSTESSGICIQSATIYRTLLPKFVFWPRSRPPASYMWYEAFLQRCYYAAYEGHWRKPSSECTGSG